MPTDALDSLKQRDEVVCLCCPVPDDAVEVEMPSVPVALEELAGAAHRIRRQDQEVVCDGEQVCLRLQLSGGLQDIVEGSADPLNVGQ